MKKLFYNLFLAILLIGISLNTSKVYSNTNLDGANLNPFSSVFCKSPQSEYLITSPSDESLESLNIDENIPVQDFRSIVANFSADATLLAVGTSANFTDQSTGSITSWTWSFPGGSPSTYSGKIPPPIYYNTAGSYNVTLTISDGTETVFLTKNDYITVVNYPSGWSFTPTGTSHLISVATNISFSTPLSAGDFIGAFYLDGGVEKCGGASVWDGVHNKVVVAYGDDATTNSLKEGFADQENFIWKVFFNQTLNVATAAVTYNTSLPNSNGKFADNGLSALLSVNTNPLVINVTASLSQVCSGTMIQLNVAASGGSGTYTYSWTSNPAGFTSNISNPTHTPLQTTTYLVTVYDGVSSSSGSVTVTVISQATANAGVDAATCENTAKALSGTASNYASLLWTTNGNGTFSNNAIINPTYTPGTTDISAGSVILTFKANPINPCTVAATDFMILSISKLPVANAGTNATICQTATHQLSGSAQYQSSVLWTTSGNGTFSNTTILNPVYTPGANDIANGAVSLTLTASAVSPCTNPVSSAKTLVIQTLPFVNAGIDQTICQDQVAQLNGFANNYSSFLWTGNVSNPGVLNPVFTPTPENIAAGYAELCLTAQALNPCIVSTTDCVGIYILKIPVVDAGEEATICEGEEFSTNPVVTNASQAYWTTTGDGYFMNENSPHTVYFPGENDLADDSVELCLIATGSGPCSQYVVEDCLTLSFQTSPYVKIGNDETICEGSTYQLDVTIENQNSVLWSTSGDGTFNNVSIPNPIYTPGSDDIFVGTVELTVTVEAVSPCYEDASDYMTLTIQNAPFVFAGNDMAVCESEVANLSNANANNYSSLLWFSLEGSGTFSDDNIVNPVYYPSFADYQTGCIRLYLMAAPINPCSISVIDSLQLCFQKPAEAFAGGDASICGTASYTISDASANYFGSLQWASSGDGAFDNPTLLHAVYTPGSFDLISGVVELTISAQSLSPCLFNASDQLTITILPSQEINIQAGWSGVSGYVQPLDATIENVMSEVLPQLVIMYNYNNEIFYPEDNINTLINWNYQQGYVIKVNTQSTLNICGNPAVNRTINLTAGWNIIPVLAAQDVPVADIFAPLGSTLTIIKEIAGYHVYYPEYDIYTLTSLVSGKAYFVKVTEDCSITFP